MPDLLQTQSLRMHLVRVRVTALVAWRYVGFWGFLRHVWLTWRWRRHYPLSQAVHCEIELHYQQDKLVYPGIVYLPRWRMEQLRLEIGNELELYLHQVKSQWHERKAKD